MDLLKALQWRYAVKKFDPSKKVDQGLVDKIIEAAWLAPTSSGLQPFQVIDITNQELKDKIVPIAFDQHQVADCSHLLVFAAWDNYTAERIDRIYHYTITERGQEPGHYNAYVDRLKAIYLNRPAEVNFEHAARQSYIAFAFSIMMAAELKVDSTPMEGFDNEALDNLLNLHESRLRSVTMLPLGYRDTESDWLVDLKKVRHPMEEFLIEIK
ncbi:nitroreductase family protein [uncultured Parabacteroides sp.]|uniref:nitroreductase family protein n=1 Tax=uncultured Parabacteroides sp. TaxID=512312 RepID=UPI0025FF9BF7|nr:nitroreductase family protein [uncultured Parabacteroides sp.]